MSIIKALFLGLKNQKVIPFNQMTPELHEQLSRGLAKIMMAAKMTKAQLTKSQRDYIMNQAKQVQEFEDRYITKIKDSAGNIIKKGKEKVADVFDLEGRTLDPSKVITGGTQEGAALQSGIMKATKAKPTKVPETEAQIAERIKRENKEAVKNFKKKMEKDRDFSILDPEDMAEGGRIGLKEGEGIMKMASYGYDDAMGEAFEEFLRLKKIKEIPMDMEFDEYLDSLDRDIPFSKKNMDSPSIKLAEGGRIGLQEGTNKNMFETLFYNKSAPILSALNTSELFDLVTTLSSGIPGLAEGGRINYAEGPKDPRRRGFMKTAMGIASMLPFGIGKGIKLAKPAVEKAAEITGPALQKIIETVNELGRVISVSGRRVKEMVTKKKYKDIEVEEDVGDGSFIIKKGDKEIYYKPGRMDETGGVEDDIIEVIESRIDRQSGGVAMMLGE
tara:strand:+ start:51 stop:1382 length:1332 start_codon:yes stop_codon:yes gene_type:complete